MYSLKIDWLFYNNRIVGDVEGDGVDGVEKWFGLRVFAKHREKGNGLLRGVFGKFEIVLRADM